jgi:hypothetical protein
MRIAAFSVDSGISRAQGGSSLDDEIEGERDNRSGDSVGKRRFQVRLSQTEAELVRCGVMKGLPLSNFPLATSWR